MGSAAPYLIRLGTAEEIDALRAGGKAKQLARLAGAGFRVPRGFCLTADAYERFVGANRLQPAIQMELGRKSMEEMRWEEIWDAALRIRTMFLSQPLPEDVQQALAAGVEDLDSTKALAVRSSALAEDSFGSSFAGLHESVLGVRGKDSLADAVRLVWASLWSDAALLYRKELGLDATQSKMAVVVQEIVEDSPSGVAFGRDPRNLEADRAVIESVPGPCHQLVDGAVDPDHWEVDRRTGEVIVWLPGKRSDRQEDPLLRSIDLDRILDSLITIEQLLGSAADMEWTGLRETLTILQARPITSQTKDDGSKRSWYMTLRPNDAELRRLRDRVAGELMPQLEREGQDLVAEDLAKMADCELGAAIRRRVELVAKWKKIYWQDFIPFAHGVRRLATYYNDAVRPTDPYEFVGLLRNQPLLAHQRNRALEDMARILATNDALTKAIEELLETGPRSVSLEELRNQLSGSDSVVFLEHLSALHEEHLDITFDGFRLCDQLHALLRNLLQWSRRQGLWKTPEGAKDLRYLCSKIVSSKRSAKTGARKRWKCSRPAGSAGSYDDDNLLVSRLESQLLRSLKLAAARLRERGILSGEDDPLPAHAELLANALVDPGAAEVALTRPAPAPAPSSAWLPSGQSPRQLIGQPASPGVGVGLVRRIQGREDLGDFVGGEVLVCDAIQPTMTHLVPLAGAIIERRGGMLIHGAIIARELGIPCVNGVRDAADLLENGDFVTVDGYLGIVTVGVAELDIELSR